MNLGYINIYFIIWTTIKMHQCAQILKGFIIFIYNRFQIEKRNGLGIYFQKEFTENSIAIRDWTQQQCSLR